MYESYYAHSHVKSYYGTQIVPLFDKCMIDLYKAWHIAIYRVWHILWQTHFKPLLFHNMA